MTFTRLTIVGAARRADLVVPDDETFSALLPDILDAMGLPRPDALPALPSA